MSLLGVRIAFALRHQRRFKPRCRFLVSVNLAYSLKRAFLASAVAQIWSALMLGNSRCAGFLDNRNLITNRRVPSGDLAATTNNNRFGIDHRVSIPISLFGLTSGVDSRIHLAGLSKWVYSSWALYRLTHRLST